MNSTAAFGITAIIAYLFILFIFLVIAYIPLYFTIKWAVRKALREVANDGVYRQRNNLDDYKAR
jgi:hypothetical protein